MSKNFGPAVSGYLDPTGRGWETTVFQSGKPVLDKELNLQQDIDGGQAEAALLRAMPSGWLSDDFLISSNPTSAIFTQMATANTLQIPNGLFAHVNGWLLKIQDTNMTGANSLVLSASPAGNGVKRTDLVVLEVWRMLLSATPSTVGKSATGRIWQQGNVKTDPANDLVLNYADDIEDGNVGSETTKRVQIQYRLRVVTGVDIYAYPYGMNDATVVANSVPPNAATPDGTATLFTYTNQSANGDAGLWVAGDGNPANTLGTVDGYMYAIPLMAVFRRNTNAFDRLLNQNGGVASPGPSDRPDGYFYDIFVPRDIVDLRTGVSPTGWNYAEVLEKNFNFLLDNNLHSEWGSSPAGDGGGYNGATIFLADEIGVSTANGGGAPNTGDNAGGTLIGQFDAALRRFSDRSIYETVTVEIPAPLGGWVNGSTVTLDPSALPIYPYAAFNWTAYAPAQVVITDIESAWWIGATGKKTASALYSIQSITNLGVMPVAALTLTFGTIAGLGLTNESLYVDLLIAYPTSVGLTMTPTATYGTSSFVVNNPAQLPAGAPISFSALANQAIDASHREVLLQYTTSNLTVTQAADTTIAANPYFRLPERAATIVTVLKNGNPLVGAVSLDSTGRIGTFANVADYTSSGDTLTITYTALRPLPQNNEQITVYYEAAAPQTARSALIGTSLQIIPKCVSREMYSLTVGSGSQDEGYPWPQGYVQTGGIWPDSTNTYNGEGDLSARADVAVAEFNASTGFLQLPVYVPMVANPEGLTFTRVLSDIDVENRTFFKSIPGGTYVPNAYAQDLSDPKRHKDILPILGQLAADSSLGFKGQLVLVLLVRYALFDETNGVFFNSDQTVNTTIASVFRIKGNLLDKRAV